MRSTTFFFTILSLFLVVVLPVAAQECSATKHCATGCCSKHGFCGTTKDHCGDGCQSTCDFKLGCDANNPCKDGTCCSKFGFCGFGKDFCSPENCVAGCNAKSQCDPGNFGQDYVELKKCPLNVCCSKYGYCGATSEFCGDKKVKRPSCAIDKNNESMGRVVGYYEGWAARRRCQAYMPEDIPLGVYTHLNFAFAGIDPNTFKIVPAQAEDIALYRRLTGLKKKDSALKVYIAIGGWTFNDPGPTFRTFSELAADESKQKTFFASLISFMNTYDFDGVDIDWEYPVDKDRGGMPSDFQNFPKFLKNLKAALDSSSGGRNGISITLPVSFWYLQNFDIAELEKWVDFFNIMSYDLHGRWDSGNKWLGAYLNSHTNMTEITEYLDLFWRNDIKPEKVTLGLAFYSRTFMAAEKGCTKAKCMFDSVGEAGPCSADEIGGTLTNAELTDQIRAAGVTPTLDKEAMVKVAVIGRKWITYDDEDTFKLKADAARKMCLGGVMVWAVSQDYTNKGAIAAAVGGNSKRASGLFDTRYSVQLQSATKYKSMKAVTVESDTGDIDMPSPKIVRDQCYWSNCGAGCGKGFKSVPRLDTDSHKNEVMQDSYHCQGGTLRHFCCPDSKTIPKCGWFDFYNGKCGKQGGCPAGSEKIVAPSDQQREVGSTQVACNNGKAQVACCQTEDSSGKALDSMMGYDSCKWFGKTNNECDAYGAVEELDPGGARGDACKLKDPSRSWYMIETFWGSGATYCRNSKWKDLDQYRPLCCAAQENSRWNGCKMVFGTKKDGNFCEASCPAGTIRMAMEKPEVYHNCKGGGHAYCCTPGFMTEANNADEVHHGYVLAVKNVIENPGQCKWGDIEKDIDKDKSKRLSVSKTDCLVALYGTMNMLGSPDIGIRRKFMNDWNLATGQAGMPGITADFMQAEPQGYSFKTAPNEDVQMDTAEGLLNSAEALNDDKGKTKERKWRCPVEWEWDASVDYREDIDDGGSEIIDPDLFGPVIHFRRRRDEIDGDAPVSAGSVSEPESVFDAESEFDSDSDLDSESESGPHLAERFGSETGTSEPRKEDWLGGLEKLRHLASYLNNDDKKTEDQPKFVFKRSEDECDKSYRCRAKKLGFDLDNSDDRMAYHNMTIAEAAKNGRRYEEAFERRERWRNGTLDKRDFYQQGQPRAYTVKAMRSDWNEDIIESSQYPNGNQGDDLIALNNDPSRYVIKSTGCGPQDYELKTRARKADVNGIWVTEHILELNTIGRFMTASLDGALGPLIMQGFLVTIPPYPLRHVSTDEVDMFAYLFPEWKSHSALTAADICLLKLGSMEERVGLVVCDSALNLMKTKIYKLQNPVGVSTWDLNCIFATPQSLERALAYIQTIMGVFDYYDDSNVKTRHAAAYNLVMDEMSFFEASYQRQRGLNINRKWQDNWNDYMGAHFIRVSTHARIWVSTKLSTLYATWESALHGCSGVEMCLYCIAAVSLIGQHIEAVDQGQKLVFDQSIFDAAD